jgi:hypothetical protein
MGYNVGADLTTFWASDDSPGMDPAFGVITGRRVILEAVARRLMTPRGSLSGTTARAREYGFDIRGFSQAKMSPTQLGRLRSGIVAECLKDERIRRAEAEVSIDLATSVLTVSIAVDTNQGPFSFVLGADDLTVTILEDGL